MLRARCTITCHTRPGDVREATRANTRPDNEEDVIGGDPGFYAPPLVQHLLAPHDTEEMILERLLARSHQERLCFGVAQS